MSGRKPGCIAEVCCHGMNSDGLPDTLICSNTPKPVDVGALVARLNKSCRYAGTNNEHGSPISACPGACKEHALMTESARALLALQAEVARLTQERDRNNVETSRLLMESANARAKLLADVERLTQENARLRGEIAGVRGALHAYKAKELLRKEASRDEQ